ncbi:molybdate ABC transporter substrate-binding protein [Phytohalomonas tamaricis]|uniref:molybdate ABC transporter substrate-binding protein n=1 Tax=Phytohalomonas tamaricis TaxID=2081032 RepID=UPI000D0B6BB2|nr:molybdate ABC transporter substrate-binding protein [Phytohalomonas tamaricis]
MSGFVSRLLIGTATVATLVLSPLTFAADKIQVYAAASLTDVMNTLAADYEKQHEVDIVPVYASSSTVARQVANGAPADIFFSANEKWMDWLAAQGITLTARADLLQNRLALIAPQNTDIASFTPDAEHPLVDELADDSRLAVGDPDHVPAGIYAKQALKSLGEWNTLEPRLARSDNVRAALALVERGETPLGIVYATDAKASDKVKQLGLFPVESHKPITYPVALVNDTPSQAAQAFLTWLKSDEAAKVFRQYGFDTDMTSLDDGDEVSPVNGG